MTAFLDETPGLESLSASMQHYVKQLNKVLGEEQADVVEYIPMGLVDKDMLTDDDPLPRYVTRAVVSSGAATVLHAPPCPTLLGHPLSLSCSAFTMCVLIYKGMSPACRPTRRS